jgi:putative flippase GtrA
MTWQAISFAVIGLLSTLATVALYALGREWWSPLEANLVALTVTTVFNTEANRRFTFIGAGRSLVRVHTQAALVFLGYYALTSVALLTVSSLVAQPPRALEVGVLLGASVLGTVGRFLLLRGWIFAASTRRKDIR